MSTTKTREETWRENYSWTWEPAVNWQGTQTGFKAEVYDTWAGKHYTLHLTTDYFEDEDAKWDLEIRERSFPTVTKFNVTMNWINRVIRTWIREQSELGGDAPYATSVEEMKEKLAEEKRARAEEQKIRSAEYRAAHPRRMARPARKVITALEVEEDHLTGYASEVQVGDRVRSIARHEGSKAIYEWWTVTTVERDAKYLFVKFEKPTFEHTVETNRSFHENDKVAYQRPAPVATAEVEAVPVDPPTVEVPQIAAQPVPEDVPASASKPQNLDSWLEDLLRELE